VVVGVVGPTWIGVGVIELGNVVEVGVVEGDVALVGVVTVVVDVGPVVLAPAG
jgi:hypothetical protein